MSILALQILPSLAIARLGSSPEPLENYDLVVTDPLGHREIRPAETLRIDPSTGEIADAYTPTAPIRFRDGPRIRPVSPFLELFARTGPDTLEPLTTALLAAEGLSASDVMWTVTAANIKAFRRTGHVIGKNLQLLRILGKQAGDLRSLVTEQQGNGVRPFHKGDGGRTGARPEARICAPGHNRPLGLDRRSATVYLQQSTADEVRESRILSFNHEIVVLRHDDAGEEASPDGSNIELQSRETVGDS